MKRTFKYISITLWNTSSKNIQNSILYQASKDKSVKYYWNHLVINLILFYTLDQCIYIILSLKFIWVYTWENRLLKIPWLNKAHYYNCCYYYYQAIENYPAYEIRSNSDYFVANDALRLSVVELTTVPAFLTVDLSKPWFDVAST